jgi:hypothetical protein
MSKHGQNKITTVIIIGILIWGGLTLYDRHQAKRDCDYRALAAAIDQYPLSEYPDTQQRDVLQQAYEDKYLETC